MEQRFPVLVHGILKTDSHSLALRDGEESKTIEVSVPEKRRPEQTHLEVRYSPSIALALVDALPHLVHHPRKDSLSTAIQDQWRVIDKEIGVKEERKAVAAELVDEYLMDIYDGLRERKQGRVVGRLDDGICGACHLSLSPAEVARISKDDPPRCIHCRSILVI